MSTDAGSVWSYRTPVARGFSTTAFAGDPDHRHGDLRSDNARTLLLHGQCTHMDAMVPLLHPGSHRPSVLCFACRSLETRRRFAGTEARGIYRSTDAGATWAPIPPQKDSSLATASIWSIIVDPGRPDRVLAAAGALGLITSTNGGETWTSLARGSTQVGARSTHLLIHPRDGNILLLGTDAGSIFRTTNGGATLESRSSAACRKHASAHSAADPALARRRVRRNECRDPRLTRLRRELAAAQRLVSPGSRLRSIPASGAGARLFAFGNAIGLQTSTDRGTHVDRTRMSISEERRRPCS